MCSRILRLIDFLFTVAKLRPSMVHSSTVRVCAEANG